jgi:hypothetical protein
MHVNAQPDFTESFSFTGTHSTSRRVALLSGSFRARAIAGKKKSYVCSLPVEPEESKRSTGLYWKLLFLMELTRIGKRKRFRLDSFDEGS